MPKKVSVVATTALSVEHGGNTQSRAFSSLPATCRLGAPPGFRGSAQHHHAETGVLTRLANPVRFCPSQVGKYEIHKTLGEGTFGKVKRAFNTASAVAPKQRQRALFELWRNPATDAAASAAEA